VQIQAPTDGFVSLHHDARGLLVKVTGPQSRSLVQNYLASKDAESGERFQGMQSIDSPVGKRQFTNPGDQPAAVGAQFLLHPNALRRCHHRRTL
jgi:hypothetical protein